LIFLGIVYRYANTGFIGKNYIVISAVVFVLTILFGRVFCGWWCPWGFLFELSYMLRAKLFKLKKLPRVPDNIHNKLIYFKYVVLALVIILVYLKLNYGGILPNNMLSGSMISLSILITFIVVSFFIPRAFCRYFCPVGALLSIISIKPLFKLKLNDNCVKCRLCEWNCPMQIELTKNIRQRECVRCFECKSVCRKKAVDFKHK